MLAIISRVEIELIDC